MLSNTSSKELEIFFSQFKPVFYRKRNILVQAGENSNFVFYIKKGYVRAYRVSEQGEELTLVILKPGDSFPFIWESKNMLGNYYLESVTSLEIVKIPQGNYLQFLESHHQVFHELTNYMLASYGGLLTRIEYLVFGNAYRKVASTVLVCAKRFGINKGGEVTVELPLTHKDIANLVGITRETTCLEMKKLERKGLISHKGRLLVVSNVKKLEEESLLSQDQMPLLHNSL